MCDPVYDLCIVGAGMFGSAAARHASAMAGVKVCLVGPDEPTQEERLKRELFSAYYDEGRITWTMDDDLSFALLSKQSISRYRELEQLSGVKFYHPVGYLFVSTKDSPFLKKVLQTSSLSKIPVVDLSYDNIFKKRFPFIKLKENDHPLFDDAGAGYISPRKMVEAQIKVAQNQGCDLIRKVVNEVKPLAKGLHEVITEDNAVVKAKRILLCTGAFTNLKKFPIPKLNFHMHKETFAFLKIPAHEADRLSSMPSMIYCLEDEKVGAYILPPVLYPNGNYYLKVGHNDFEFKTKVIKTLGEVRDWYLSEGDPSYVDSLSKLLIDLLPGLVFEEVTGKTCVTSHCASRLPYIDRVSPTVTVAAVGNGKGASLSDEVGRIAAVLSITGQWDSEVPQNSFRLSFDEEI